MRLVAGCAVLLLLGTPAAAHAQADTSAGPATPADRSTHPGFSDIIRSLRFDFAQAVSPANLMVLGLGGSGAWGAHIIDGNVARTRWGTDDVFTPGNIAGSALAQGSGAFATYLIGRAFDAPRVSQLGSELVRAQIVSQTLTQTIKFTTARTRPDGTPLSLPSGHTSSAFATATVLQSNFGWKVGAPAYAVAAWIGASRVQMKRHFVSDVIAGAAIGLVAGRSVTVGRGDFRFAMVPTAAPGGAGVNFVHIGSR